ncbi:uncharacterized protein V1516DRAFT_667029 [Lipomyces oligophaga]|uniref:uncharacterized protein n=1 Tax=Lipomyces oligophaga TaxID=45792 RepID=UPI0034CEDED9
MFLGSLTTSLVALLAGLPAGLPVALAFFNSTLIPSGLGPVELDISTLQGQRVVKLVQHTPPSITTTWAFFDLFEPLELTDDFPDDSDACVGHEGCIIRTVTLPDSKHLTIHTIPLDSSHTISTSSFQIWLENAVGPEMTTILYIDFHCDKSAINSMQDEISTIDINGTTSSSEANLGILKTNASSNFFGIRRLRPLDNGLYLSLDSSITCAEDQLEEDYSLVSADDHLVYGASSNWRLTKLALIMTLAVVISFVSGSTYGKRQRAANDIDFLPFVQTTSGFSRVTGDLAHRVARGANSI